MKVAGRGSGRVSIAGLIAARPGSRTRLFYRASDASRPQEQAQVPVRGDYIGLIDAAHQQLKAPIILVWDRLNTHVSKTMEQKINARDWLIVFLLPAYAPD